MSTHIFKVSGKQMLKLLQEKNDRLHRWALVFFRMNPETLNYLIGDAPQKTWTGTTMWQQRIKDGGVSKDRVLRSPSQPPVAQGPLL